MLPDQSDSLTLSSCRPSSTTALSGEGERPLTLVEIGHALDYLTSDAYMLLRYVTVVAEPYGNRRGKARRS